VGLVFGLLLGVVFGMAQELRGAHFLSHDLWSLAVAWTCASLLYYGFFLRAPKVESVNLAHSVSMINAK